MPRSEIARGGSDNGFGSDEDLLLFDDRAAHVIFTDEIDNRRSRWRRSFRLWLLLRARATCRLLWLGHRRLPLDRGALRERTIHQAFHCCRWRSRRWANTLREITLDGGDNALTVDHSFLSSVVCRTKGIMRIADLVRKPLHVHQVQRADVIASDVACNPRRSPVSSREIHWW